MNCHPEDRPSKHSDTLQRAASLLQNRRESTQRKSQTSNRGGWKDEMTGSVPLDWNSGFLGSHHLRLIKRVMRVHVRCSQRGSSSRTETGATHRNLRLSSLSQMWIDHCKHNGLVLQRSRSPETPK